MKKNKDAKENPNSKRKMFTAKFITLNTEWEKIPKTNEETSSADIGVGSYVAGDARNTNLFGTLSRRVYPFWKKKKSDAVKPKDPSGTSLEDFNFDGIRKKGY